MKIHASFSRKVGLPNYSSVGAECSVEIDLDETDPARVTAQIRLAYAIAADAVEEQLQTALEAPGPAPIDRPAVVPTDRRPQPSDRPTDRRPEPEPEPETDQTEDREPPTDGRQLMGWLQYFDRVDGRRWLPELVRWGKEQGFPWKVIQWSEDEVAEAVLWFLKRRQGKARRAPGAARGASGRAYERHEAAEADREMVERRSGREARRNGGAR